VSAFVDQRFFEGGKFYVDTTDGALGVNRAQAALPATPLAVAQTENKL
jgi:hypothetical protein